MDVILNRRGETDVVDFHLSAAGLSAAACLTTGVTDQAVGAKPASWIAAGGSEENSLG